MLTKKQFYIQRIHIKIWNWEGYRDKDLDMYHHLASVLPRHLKKRLTGAMIVTQNILLSVGALNGIYFPATFTL